MCQLLNKYVSSYYFTVDQKMCIFKRACNAPLEGNLKVYLYYTSYFCEGAFVREKSKVSGYTGISRSVPFIFTQRGYYAYLILSSEFNLTPSQRLHTHPQHTPYSSQYVMI